MKTAPMCPRCGGPVSEPSAWSSGWQCQWHGVVYPLRAAYRPVPEGLKGLLRDAVMPVWRPLPDGWLAGHRLRRRRGRPGRDARLRGRAVRAQPDGRPG
ncbi:MAG TPA: DUF6758 family protein [Streptosporangiaceae bacterium]